MFDRVSIAIRQQRDGNVAFSRAKQQAHSPFSAGAARLRGHSTSRRHRYAEPRATASAPARLPCPPSLAPLLRPRELHGALCACAADSATCGAPPPKCRRRRASSTLPRGTPMATIPARIVNSTRHAIGRHVRSAARVPIISSSVLAFSHGPSFSIRPLPPRFLCSTPHGHPFLSSAYFHAPRGVSPFSPRSNFERLRRSRTLRKTENTLSRERRPYAFSPLWEERARRWRSTDRVYNGNMRCNCINSTGLALNCSNETESRLLFGVHISRWIPFRVELRKTIYHVHRVIQDELCNKLRGTIGLAKLIIFCQIIRVL